MYLITLIKDNESLIGNPVQAAKLLKVSPEAIRKWFRVAENKKQPMVKACNGYFCYRTKKME